jgi:hypothetical protein
MSTMLLDPITGLDPPGVKVRAAEGIEAASSFIQGYWLWFVVCSYNLPGAIWMIRTGRRL